MTRSMTTEANVEDMIVDGTPTVEISNNPYGVLAMEEDEPEPKEVTQDVVMEDKRVHSPRRAATKRDDRSEDTRSPNLKQKKIQKGEALRAAADLAKDEYRYSNVHENTEASMELTGDKEILETQVAATTAKKHPEASQASKGTTEQERMKEVITGTDGDEGSKNPAAIQDEANPEDVFPFSEKNEQQEEEHKKDKKKEENQDEMEGTEQVTAEGVRHSSGSEVSTILADQDTSTSTDDSKIDDLVPEGQIDREDAISGNLGQDEPTGQTSDEHSMESNNSVGSHRTTTANDELKQKLAVLAAKNKIKRERRKQAKQRKKEAKERRFAEAQEERGAMAEQERLRIQEEEVREKTKQKHDDLHQQVKELQAQLDELLAQEAVVADELLDQGEMLMTRTTQGPALIEREDVIQFPRYKRPKEVYPQRMPPSRAPPRKHRHAEQGVAFPVFSTKIKQTKYLLRYDLKMDDLPANTEVATLLMKQAKYVWSSGSRS